MTTLEASHVCPVEGCYVQHWLDDPAAADAFHWSVVAEVEIGGREGGSHRDQADKPATIELMRWTSRDDAPAHPTVVELQVPENAGVEAKVMLTADEACQLALRLLDAANVAQRENATRPARGTCSDCEAAR